MTTTIKIEKQKEQIIETNTQTKRQSKTKLKKQTNKQKPLIVGKHVYVHWMSSTGEGGLGGDITGNQSNGSICQNRPCLIVSFVC